MVTDVPLINVEIPVVTITLKLKEGKFEYTEATGKVTLSMNSGLTVTFIDFEGMADFAIISYMYSVYELISEVVTKINKL